MANTFSIISIVSFVLAAVFFVLAVALFFAMNVNSAYRELRGQPQRQWIVGNKKEKTKVKKQEETPTQKTDFEDEAVTTLDNGEEVTMASLMNVYEPGTDVMDEVKTEVETSPIAQVYLQEDECATEMETQQQNDGFIIVKRKIIIHSNEILR